jgi:hypothetical protein
VKKKVTKLKKAENKGNNNIGKSEKEGKFWSKLRNK